MCERDWRRLEHLRLVSNRGKSVEILSKCIAVATRNGFVGSTLAKAFRGKDALRRTLAQVHRCLKMGELIDLYWSKPKYLPGAYWDFWHHYIPLTNQRNVGIERCARNSCLIRRWKNGLHCFR
jgi:hypothetical protein